MKSTLVTFNDMIKILGAEYQTGKHEDFYLVRPFLGDKAALAKVLSVLGSHVSDSGRHSITITIPKTDN